MSNRLLSIDKDLNAYKRPGKKQTGHGKHRKNEKSNGQADVKGPYRKHASSRHYYSESKDEPRVSTTVVADDVFTVEILEYFFGKKVNEKQLTNDLRNIAAKTLWTATEASRTMDLVPRPPKGVPTPAWLVSEIVQIGYRRATNKGIYQAVKDTVTLKWRSTFEIALMESQAGIAQSILEQSVLSQEMAIGNTALVVFIENTGALPFEWESKVGKALQSALEKAIDYVSEEFVKWLNKFGDAKGKKYKEVIILEDAKATYPQLKMTLHDLAKRDFIIDVFTLAHGNRTSFSGFLGVDITDSQIRAIRDTFGKPLPIRVVYQMNCKAGGLNDDWMYVGARAVAGAVENNYIPEPMMSKFWSNWQRGDNFKTAVNNAYTDSVKAIKGVIGRVQTGGTVVGTLVGGVVGGVAGYFLGGKAEDAIESAVDPLLKDSIPKIEGNADITIATAQLATVKSYLSTRAYAASADPYALEQAFFSEAQYGTGEHVLSGLVNEGPVTPTYELDVNGVKFTYAELIAMGDFYDTYQQMSTANGTELAKLKGLIDRSKKYYEGKVLRGSPVGTDPTDADWQGATSDRYLKLAEDNFAHFAPSNNQYITNFTSTKTNHRKEWEKYHTQAIDVMRSAGNSSAAIKALPINAFGDHFLTDAFAAGHLFNKDDLSEYFKSRVMSGGKVNADGTTMFTNIANKAFVGNLKATFSQYETVDKYKGVFRPDIYTADRFKSLLIGIMEQQPDIVGKTMVAKLVHDELNRYRGGVPVTNAIGDRWSLTGDDTLNVANLDIMRKAVKQSIKNLIDCVSDKSPVSTFVKKVWDIAPQPVPNSITIIKDSVRKFTDPLGTDIVNGAAILLQNNYKALLDELVKRKVLQKA